MRETNSKDTDFICSDAGVIFFWLWPQNKTKKIISLASLLVHDCIFDSGSVSCPQVETSDITRAARVEQQQGMLLTQWVVYKNEHESVVKL